MSEHHASPEHHHGPEAKPAHETDAERRHANELLREAEQRAAHEREHTPNVHELEQRAKEVAESAYGDEHGARAHETESPAHHVVMTRELKQQAFKRTLTRVRHHLKPAERSFSKFIHQSTVDKVSTVGAQTVARPSGILGGGIFAFVGSAIVLYLARTYGFSYNLFIFIILFVGGFALGTLIELGLRAIFHRRQAHD